MADEKPEEKKTKPTYKDEPVHVILVKNGEPMPTHIIAGFKDIGNAEEDAAARTKKAKEELKLEGTEYRAVDNPNFVAA